MVNYRRVVCEVALLCAVAAFASATPIPGCKDDRQYDQRQNGSENYRLNIDGVVIAIAPADSLLSAISDIDLSDLIDIDSLNDQGQKPKPPGSDVLTGEIPPPHKPEEKPVLSKPEEKPADEKPEPKPEDKPLEALDIEPLAPMKEPEAQNVEKGHKKSAQLRKQESAQRLKHRLASLFLPFLRKRRHQ